MLICRWFIRLKVIFDNGLPSPFFNFTICALKTKDKPIRPPSLLFGVHLCSPASALLHAYQQFPLAWITHVADEAATFLLER